MRFALPLSSYSTVTCDVFGEISTSAYVDIAHVVRETIKKIGYTDSENGFDYKSVGVHVSLVEQSSDIAQGVNEALRFGLQPYLDGLLILILM